MKQNVFGNMINSASDLEWFMINFIRYHEELESKVRELEEHVEEESKGLSKQFYMTVYDRLEKEVEELKAEKKELILKFLDLYKMMLQYRNDEGDGVTLKQKRDMSKFRKLMKEELKVMEEGEGIPF